MFHPDRSVPANSVFLDQNARWARDQRVERTLTALSSHGIESTFVETAKDALDATLADIPDETVVGLGGSTTLRQIGLWEALEERGIPTINQQLADLTKEERHDLRRRNVTCDYYVMSCNAIAESGAIVVANHTGNAVAALAFGAKRVLIVSSVHKIEPTLDQALGRIFTAAAPANSHRSGEWHPPCYADGICREAQCHWPDRLCNKILILYGEALEGRVHVLLVGDQLGF